MTSKHVVTVVMLLAIGATLVGCRNDDEPKATASAETSGSTPTNRVDIPATVRSNLGITFAPVERRRIDGTIRVPGSFELEPLARHEYRLTLRGRILLEVDQYQSVHPGDVLFRVQSPDWPELQHEIIVGEQDIESANAAIRVAMAKVDEANRRVSILRERLDVLAQADFKRADLEAEAAEWEASLPRLQAELHQAVTTLANARRTREHALHRASAGSGIEEARLVEQVELDGATVPAYRTIDWIDVRATHAGIVEMLGVTDGAFADTSSLVVSTVDPTRVRFRASALQSDLVRLTDNIGATIVPPTLAGADGGVSATVTLGLEAHPDQRTVTMLARPAAVREWMRPGVSAYLEVIVESTCGPALAIPRAAIVRDGIVHVFFRRDPSNPNRAIRVEADMGIDDGRWVAINSGISLRDEIILDGAYELKLATQQSGVMQKGGHFHADGTFHAEDH